MPSASTLGAEALSQMLEAPGLSCHVPHEILRKVQRLIQENPESLAPSWPCRAFSGLLERTSGSSLTLTLGSWVCCWPSCGRHAKILRKSGASLECQEGKWGMGRGQC